MNGLFRKLRPTYMTGCAFSLTPEVLSGLGIRAVILDIDGTLVPQDAPADEAAVTYIRQLKDAGIRCFILSNNGEERVKAFADCLGTDYLFKVRKPSPDGYREAMKRMGSSRQDTLVIGDQLFTDVWGAGRAGLRSVFITQPFDPSRETRAVKLKRRPEKLLLAFMREHIPVIGGKKQL